jgi:hypothetical protein
MILFDESHNEFCSISGIKKRRSYSLWKEQIDPYGLIYARSRKEFYESVQEVRTIVFAEPHSYLTLKEIQALFDFVVKGGSLILIGNHHNTPRYYSYGCNEILNVMSKPFGIRFNADEVSFYEDNTIQRFADHPLCGGMTILHYWRGCSLSLLRRKNRYTAQAIAFGSRHDTSEVYRKTPVVAAVHDKKGKIFCLGDSSVWADPFEPMNDDNLLFAENVAKWALE